MEKNRMLVIVGIIVCLCFVALLIAPTIAVDNVEATVVGFAQTQTSTIQRYQATREEGWEVPEGAFDITSFEAARSVRQISDGFSKTYRITCDDLMSGVHHVCMQTGDAVPSECAQFGLTCNKELLETKENFHDEMVYGTRYTYTMYRWVHSREIVTSSSSHSEGVHMSLGLAADERVAEQSTTYDVFYRSDEGKNYTYSCSLAEWLRFEEGQRNVVSVNILGHVLAIRDVSKVH